MQIDKCRIQISTCNVTCIRSHFTVSDINERRDDVIAPLVELPVFAPPLGMCVSVGLPGRPHRLQITAGNVITQCTYTVTQSSWDRI